MPISEKSERVNIQRSISHFATLKPIENIKTIADFSINFPRI